MKYIEGKVFIKISIHRTDEFASDETRSYLVIEETKRTNGSLVENE